jgi:hypothetical protein
VWRPRPAALSVGPFSFQKSTSREPTVPQEVAEGVLDLGAGQPRRRYELPQPGQLVLDDELPLHLGREQDDGRQDHDEGPVASAGDESGVKSLGDLGRAEEAVDAADYEQRLSRVAASAARARIASSGLAVRPSAARPHRSLVTRPRSRESCLARSNHSSRGGRTRSGASVLLNRSATSLARRRRSRSRAADLRLGGGLAIRSRVGKVGLHRSIAPRGKERAPRPGSRRGLVEYDGDRPGPTGRSAIRTIRVGVQWSSVA